MQVRLMFSSLALKELCRKIALISTELYVVCKSNIQLEQRNKGETDTPIRQISQKAYIMHMRKKHFSYV